jgi:hypothetical protein
MVIWKSQRVRTGLLGLASLTQFAAINHLPASALLLSRLKVITISGFFDGQAMSLAYHLPESQRRSRLARSTILDLSAPTNELGPHPFKKKMSTTPTEAN